MRACAQEDSLIGELEGVTVLTDVVPAKYSEAPELAALVAAGKLPPVEERVGPEPLVIRPIHEIGKYGGAWRRGFIGPNDIANATRAILHDRVLYWNYDETEIVPNLAKAYAVSDDGRVTTVTLRKGMKWSDGHPFTADDFVFWYEDMASNREITPSPVPELMVGGKPVKIEKVDEVTVRYVSENPYYTLPIKLSSTSNLGGHGRWGYVGFGGFRAGALPQAVPSEICRPGSRRGDGQGGRLRQLGALLPGEEQLLPQCRSARGHGLEDGASRSPATSGNTSATPTASGWTKPATSSPISTGSG